MYFPYLFSVFIFLSFLVERFVKLSFIVAFLEIILILYDKSILLLTKQVLINFHLYNIIAFCVIFTEGLKYIYNMYFLCIGDFGSGDYNQHSVARCIRKLSQQYQIDLILGLGDNIYPDGVKCVKDKQFQTKFELPYSILKRGLCFFQTLGNQIGRFRGLASELFRSASSLSRRHTRARAFSRSRRSRTRAGEFLFT